MGKEVENPIKILHEEHALSTKEMVIFVENSNTLLGLLQNQDSNTRILDPHMVIRVKSFNLETR